MNREVIENENTRMDITASLIVDIKSVRCSQCKMLVKDVCVTHCVHCGALFDRVTSNHVGLAEKVRREREAKRAAQQASPEPQSK